MAHVIQFSCPACHILLSVPLQAASQRGPCPHCGCHLIAPDPFSGTQAQLIPREFSTPPAPEPPVVRIEAFHTTHNIPPHRPESRPVEQQPAAKPQPPTAPPLTREVPAPTKSTWPITLGVGVLAAILGFAGGFQSAQPAHRIPAPMTAPTISHPAIPPTATPAHPSGNTLAVPKEILKAFLAAKDWRSRSAYVLFPERVTKRMESYHATNPDSPTTATRLNVEHCESDPSSELLLVVVRISTAECPAGFTVAVEETPDGWKVDWETFIEFKDMLFDRFVTGGNGDVGNYHLVIQAHPQSAGREDSVAYTLTDPVKGTDHSAYVSKGSDAAAALAHLTQDSALATPVLEIVRHVQPDGSATLEIRSVLATSWRPHL